MHLLELSFTLIQETLLVSGQELSRGVSPTLLLRETLPLNLSALRRLAMELHSLLNWQRDLKNQRARLERLGGVLYDQLLGPNIKSLLRQSRAPYLRLLLPEPLLFLPWELLFDGELALCRRFSMGRVVVLEDMPTHRPEASQGTPRLLIVYDPQDNLEHAAEEGLALNQLLRQHRDKLKVQLLNPPVPRQDVLEQLKTCGMVHFAGHAFPPGAPSEASQKEVGQKETGHSEAGHSEAEHSEAGHSEAGHSEAEHSEAGHPSERSDLPGWQLEDERLTPLDVARMAGGKHFPALVVANACYSAVCGEQTRSLPGAFLAAGARHYLGNVSELPDVVGKELACSLYEALLRGATIGEALLAARRLQAEQPERPAQAWASQVLYGDPTARYFPEPPSQGTESARAPARMGDVLTFFPDGFLTPPPIFQDPKPLEVLRPPAPAPTPVHEGGSSSPSLLGEPSSAQTDGRSPPSGPEPSASNEAAGPSGRPSWLIRALIVLPVLLISLVLGLAQQTGLLDRLDLLWEGGRVLFVSPEARFESDVVLLSLRPDPGARDHRLLYAQLLELLVRAGASPKIVAIDAWLKADSLDHQERLTRAVGEALRRFPVMFALERSRETSALLPPAPWFIEGVEAYLQGQARESCLRSSPPVPEQNPEIFEKNLQGCIDNLTQTELGRLILADVQILRPTGLAGYFGLRVPILHRGPGGQGTLGVERPHFALQLAGVSQARLDPEHQRVRFDGPGLSAPYNARGMMPVVITGPAGFQSAGQRGTGAFPAWPLEEVLHTWSAAPVLSAEGDKAGHEESSIPLLKQLAGARILVGIASDAKSEVIMDRYPTLMGNLYGVEVLANIAESILSGRVPRAMPMPGLLLLLSPLMAGLGMAAVLRKRPLPLLGSTRAGALLLGGGSLVILGISYVLLLEARIEVPPSALLLSLWLGGLAGVLIGVAERTQARHLRRKTTTTSVAGVGLLLVGAFSGQVQAEQASSQQASSQQASSQQASSQQASSQQASSQQSATGSSPSGRTPAAKAQPTTASSGRRPFERPAPVPPSAVQPRVIAVGWRLVQTLPRQVASAPLLTLDGKQAPALDTVFVGGTLEAATAPLEVTLEFRAPTRGMLVTQVLQAPFVAHLHPDGNLELTGRSIWTRLYRTVEAAGDTLMMTYDGSPAGFGSTEVLYQRKNGLFGEQGALSVIEGRVHYQRRGQDTQLSAGNTAPFGQGRFSQGRFIQGRLGSPRALSDEDKAKNIDLGTGILLPTLGSGICILGDARLKDASLVSSACFDSVDARDTAFRNGRRQLVAAAAPSGWLELGNAWLAAGDADRAADSYRRGLKEGPSDPVKARLALELGNSRWAEGRPEEARVAYEDAVNADPRLALAWNNLGVMQWRAGEVSSARRSLQRAAELNPKLMESQRNLGRVLLKEDPRAAADAWARAVELAPQDPQLLEELASALVQANDLPRAVAVGTAMAGVGALSEPLMLELAELYDLYGKELWEKGQQQLALEYYERAMELRAKSSRGK